MGLQTQTDVHAGDDDVTLQSEHDIHAGDESLKILIRAKWLNSTLAPGRVRFGMSHVYFNDVHIGYVMIDGEHAGLLQPFSSARQEEVDRAMQLCPLFTRALKVHDRAPLSMIENDNRGDSEYYDDDD